MNNGKLNNVNENDHLQCLKQKNNYSNQYVNSFLGTSKTQFDVQKKLNQ